MNEVVRSFMEGQRQTAAPADESGLAVAGNILAAALH